MMRSRAPGMALAVLLGAALAPVVAQESGPAESPAVAIERAVWEAVDRSGSAELVLETGQGASIPDDPLARGLAAALFEQARGRGDAAREAMLAALRQPPNGAGPVERASLQAAVVLALLDVGVDTRARQLFAGSSEPILELGHAAVLAREARCVEALAIVERVRSAFPPAAEPILLAAETLARCDGHDAALSWLLGVARGTRAEETPPRVMLAVGQRLFEVGDLGAAEFWCDRATAEAGAHAAYRHQASLCTAAARAQNGRLPSSRVAFLEARLATLRDAARPLAVRGEAGLGAAWMAVASPDPSLARRGLEILDEMSVLRLAEAQEESARALRALALARIERLEDASRTISAMRADPRLDPRLPWLKLLVQGSIAQRLGDAATARTSYLRVIDEGSRLGFRDLAAAAALADAEQALRTAAPLAVVERAIEAMRLFPAREVLDISPFVDPALPRRALEIALAADGLIPPVDAEGGRRVLLADRLRHALDGVPDAPLRFPDVTRHLADRDAALSLFLIGESRSYGFLVESSGLREVELLSGDALHRDLAAFLAEDARGFAPPSSFGGRLAANLVGFTGSETAMLVVPDGFLAAVPWVGLLSTSRGLAADPGEEMRVPPSVLPSLAELVRPPVPPRALAENVPRLAYLVASPADATSPTAPERLGRFESVVTADIAPGAIATELGRGGDLLHVDLPLVSAGASARESVFALKDGAALASAPASMTLAQLVEAAREPTLVTIAVRRGWGRVPESAIRAGGRAIEAGADVAIVAVIPEGLDEKTLWDDLYGALARGETIADAVTGALENAPAQPHPFLQAIGDGSLRLRPQPPRLWPFWLALGLGLTILAVSIARTLRKKRDPFDEEPPEEPA